MLTIPYPPSNCILTRLGIDYLKLKTLASQKGSFGGFRLGNSSAIILDQNTTSNVAGNIVYTGGISDLTYSIVGPHEIILTCTVEHDKGPFDIGSVAIFSDSLVPVFVGRFEYIHRKEPTNTLQAGGRWVFSMKFIQYNLRDYWDLSNLQQKQAEPVAYTLPWVSVPEKPIFSPESEQIQTDNVSGVNTNRKGYFLLPEIYDLDWTSPPFQMRLDDIDFWKIDGGIDGDNHKYNNVTPALPPAPIVYQTTLLSTNQSAGSSINLKLKLENAGNYDVDWGDGGGWQSIVSNVLTTKTYVAAYNGNVKIRTPITSVAKEFTSTVGYWNFNINSLPVGLTYYLNTGSNTTNATSTTWNSATTGFRYFVNYGAPSTRTPAQVDMMLQALANINSWAIEKYVAVNSTANAAPTGIGLAARATILTKGALTVLTN